MLIVLLSNITIELITEGNLNQFPSNKLRYVLSMVVIVVVIASAIYWYEKKTGKNVGF